MTKDKILDVFAGMLFALPLLVLLGGIFYSIYEAWGWDGVGQVILALSMSAGFVWGLFRLVHRGVL